MSDALFIVKAQRYKVKDNDTLDSIAKDNKMTWQELALFNWGTEDSVEINRFLRTRVGCHQMTKDRKNYIFTSKDEPGIVFIPQEFPVKKFSTDNVQTIKVKRPDLTYTVYIQTMDQFGNYKGNVNLVLKSLDGWPDVQLTTDGKGIGKKDGVPLGSYKVMIDGKPGYYQSYLQEKWINPVTKKKQFGRFEEAILHTDYRTEALTKIVILSKDDEKKVKERTRMTAIYGLNKELQLKGDDNSFPDFCVDNLAIAALLLDTHPDIDYNTLFNKILPSYISDHCPALSKDKYSIIVVQSSTKEITFWAGDISLGEKFTMDADIQAPFGAFTILERSSTAPLMDLGSSSYAILAKPGITGIADFVAEGSQQDGYLEELDKIFKSNKLPIVYFLPSPEELYSIALQGGTGRLEDYGSDNVESIHDRNKQICEKTKAAYNAYIRKYVGDIKDIGKNIGKTRLGIVSIGKEEREECYRAQEELFAKGAPKAIFMFPSPYGANSDQIDELFKANNSKREIDAWKEICERLDSLSGKVSQGSFFLKVKIKLEGEGSVGKYATGKQEIEIQSNFFINDRGEVQKTEIETEFTFGTGIKIGEDSKLLKKIVKKIGTEMEEFAVGYETGVGTDGEVTKKGTIRCGKYGVEITDKGGAKFEAGPMFAEMDMAKMQYGFPGFCIPITKKIGWKLSKKGKIEYETGEEGGQSEDPKSTLAEQEFVGWMCFSVNFQGLKEDTALSFFSNSPGFFERPPLYKLLAPGTHWNDLDSMSRARLVELEWEQRSWDGMAEPPETTKQVFSELTSSQQIAGNHLGIPREKWREVWEEREKEMKKQEKARE